MTPEDARRLCAVADGISVQHGCLLTLLLTTGIRIGAVERLRWRDLHGRSVTAVPEKGNRMRWLVLGPRLREYVAALAPADGDADDCPLFGHRSRRAVPIRTRQLRNWFYRVSAQARLPHLHPHDARHFVFRRAGARPPDETPVAHELFHAGNSVAMIAKFLGHRCPDTTQRFYLRLNFEEVMRNINVPPSLCN